jgi:hypothetical protein
LVSPPLLLLELRCRDGSLPLSGSELEFHEEVDPAILGASSSYSYALGDVRVGRDPPQPGERGGFSLQRQCGSMEQACKLFGEAMLADNPMRVYPIAAERPVRGPGLVLLRHALRR